MRCVCAVTIPARLCGALHLTDTHPPPSRYLSPQAEEAAIEMFKVKKLIKSLERARG